VHDASARTHLQLAAAERLENLKEMSVLGLEYAIQHHSSLDIQVDMQASQFIIPYGGFYEDSKALIIINLGNLKVQPLQKEKITSVTVKELIKMGKSEEEVLSHLKMYSYDRFFLEIVNFQVTKNHIHIMWESFNNHKYYTEH
jgi:vacuolar protein sorting-associated protein 13A/C